MKKLNIIITIMVLAMMIMMTSCSKNTTEPSDNTVTEKPSEEEPVSEEPASKEPKSDVTLEGPFIVTTCGQSPGAVMMNMVAVQAGLTSVNDNNLNADSLKADEYKTLIVTTGTSMKGMGAAGTDVNAEIERCVSVINVAKEVGLTIVGAHIEGMARRTDSADAASIEAVMELADVILVIEESDSDGFFTKYAEDNNKQLIKVENTLAISSVLK
ncbi:MAG: DUF6305 family protein [Sedimentibacter saalensis]|uniref:DUF6305 family protein n=1 Tax=Sedimentibacter saalensis TaxID=130788 RepID=UPI002B202E2B|nr:DUF6305 family protein [Sedimentibacter saalensis]MEA5094146.1 DUF6305 family protein [Sedimentibacter saalensis]